MASRAILRTIDLGRFQQRMSSKGNCSALPRNTTDLPLSRTLGRVAVTSEQGAFQLTSGLFVPYLADSSALTSNGIIWTHL